ncbi:hypothetical protein BVC71_01705 [Marivivens niveibacter]|uniref:DUF6998 domain-containing protein n=1 Tax=Marivivens niveibacter TaxID=1930667 RepID=A0A251X1R1_9RHOB|nr:hypothetical protein [Marivivens niveibacter]OUD10254.1 hypothetical protein BVC71_01705 [Marivivens niveibacter]
MTADWAIVKEQLDAIYSACEKLEQMFEGRSFRPDGHLVGSIGEAIAAYAFELDLVTASNKGFDAVSPSGVQVEIKFTQIDRVALRHEPQHLIVIQRTPRNSAILAYNGPGSLVWDNCSTMQKNGQRSIGISKLRAIDVPVEMQLAQVRKLPI